VHRVLLGKNIKENLVTGEEWYVNNKNLFIVFVRQQKKSFVFLKKTKEKGVLFPSILSQLSDKHKHSHFPQPIPKYLIYLLWV